MLVSSKKQFGKPVISLEGEGLGVIYGFQINPEDQKIRGIEVSRKGWFQGNELIQFDLIRGFGDHAITVGCEQQTPEENDFNPKQLSSLAKYYYENPGKIYGLPVITTDGHLLGKVEDFYFEADTGQIEKFILSGGLLQNLRQGKVGVPISLISKIGKDAILVEKRQDQEYIELTEKITPGLEDTINDLQLEEKWDQTWLRAQDIAKGWRDKLKHKKEQGSEMMEKVTEPLEDQINDLETKWRQWQERVSASKQCKHIPEDLMEAVVGKQAGTTLVDSNGDTLITEAEMITEEIMLKAFKSNLLYSLVMSVATKEVTDRLQNLNV